MCVFVDMCGAGVHAGFEGHATFCQTGVNNKKIHS